MTRNVYLALAPLLIAACGGATKSDENGSAGASNSGSAASVASGSTSSSGGGSSTSDGGVGANSGGSHVGGDNSAGANTGGSNTGGSSTGGSSANYQTNKVSCGSNSCPASDSAFCCYEGSGKTPLCGTTDASPCSTFPQTSLHCDSSKDCDVNCAFDKVNRLALCDIAPDGVQYIQLCDPAADTCATGTCQPTTLDGVLPPGLHACL